MHSNSVFFLNPRKGKSSEVVGIYFIRLSNPSEYPKPDFRDGGKACLGDHRWRIVHDACEVWTHVIVGNRGSGEAKKNPGRLRRSASGAEDGRGRR